MPSSGLRSTAKHALIFARCNLCYPAANTFMIMLAMFAPVCVFYVHLFVACVVMGPACIGRGVAHYLGDCQCCTDINAGSQSASDLRTVTSSACPSALLYLACLL